MVGPDSFFDPEPRPAPALDFAGGKNEDAAAGFEVFEGAAHALEVAAMGGGGIFEDFEREEPLVVNGMNEDGVAENEGVGPHAEGEVGSDEGVEGSVGMVGDDEGGAGFGDFGDKFVRALDGDVQELVTGLIGIAMSDGNAGRHGAEAGDSENFVEPGRDTTSARGAREKRILLFESEEGVGVFLGGASDTAGV